MVISKAENYLEIKRLYKELDEATSNDQLIMVKLEIKRRLRNIFKEHSHEV